MMTKPIDKFYEFVNRMGEPLTSLGINEIGLLRDDGLKAIDLLRFANVPALGGDVYFRHDDPIEVAYANWYTNQDPGEERTHYIRRSYERAETYLRNFPQVAGAEVLFVIIAERL